MTNATTKTPTPKTSAIVRILASGLGAEPLVPCQFVPPSAALQGDPQEQGTIHHADPSRGLSIGTWECTPYAEIIDAAGWTEYACVLSGRVRITADDGPAEEFGPGESYIVHAATRVRYEVIERLRKIYVLLQPDAT